MRGMGRSTLRGGQTVFHGLRMWGQLFQAAIMLAAFMAVAVPAWNLWRSTSGYEWYAATMYTLAEAKLAFGYDPDSGQDVRAPDGTYRVLTIRDMAASRPAWEIRERIRDEMFASALLGVQAGLVIIALFLAWFWYRGMQLGRRRRLRGAELVSTAELRRRVRPLQLRALDRVPGSARLRPYSIAGIPYPARTETQHTIVSGTTGSGKTVLISDLVAQIRARGERCVLYDKMGSYTAAFFEPGRDVLLNPLDARAPRWSPFLEARTPRDFDMMAAALIPQQKDTVDPFWVTAARQLFANGAGVLRQKGVTENRVLVDHLLKTDLTALAQAMEGTVAQSIVDPDNPKTALSVRAMLTANLGALEFLPDEGAPFSIREWISADGGGFLFLTSRGDQHASLRGLISTWLEIAVNAMLSLAQEPERRIWVILDELPTLHQVPSLQPGLAESRQFGGCFVLGVQVASALRDLYGRNGAETISGLCGTRVVLAAPDRDTAQWSADSLGRSEVEEVAEGFSYGANTIRDGVSLTPRRELRALALPSEIMRLPNLHGYLKFPGPLPVAEIRLKYVNRPASAARFVAREGEAAAGDGGNGASHEGCSARGAALVQGELEFQAPEKAKERANGKKRGRATSAAGAEPAWIAEADAAPETESSAADGGNAPRASKSPVAPKGGPHTQPKAPPGDRAGRKPAAEKANGEAAGPGARWAGRRRTGPRSGRIGGAARPGPAGPSRPGSGRPRSARRPDALLRWSPRSAPSLRLPRASPTTSATATTRTTIRSTATPVRGPARARRRSGSPAPSIRTPSARCSKARCRTAPGARSGGATATGSSSTVPAATSPSRPRSRSRSRRWSAATGAWSTPTIARSRRPSPGSRRTRSRPG